MASPYSWRVNDIDSAVPSITADDVLAKVAAASGRLALKGLSQEELAAWQHASKIAYLRLLRAGRTRLSRHVGSEPGSYFLHLDEVRAGRPGAPVVDEDDDEDDDEDSLPYEDREFLYDRPEPRRERPDFSHRRVRVPSALPANPHPWVVKMRTGIDVLTRNEWIRNRWDREYVESWVPQVPRQKAGRVLRIWQAILVEAEARGYGITESGWRNDLAIALVVEHDEHPVQIGGSKDGLWLRLDRASSRSKTDVWTDSPALPLERQLDQVFARLERVTQDKLDKKWRDHHEYLERRVMWRIAMREARVAFAEDFRLRVLHRRVADIRQAERIRGYATALRARASRLDEDSRQGPLAWAAWALDYADRIDANGRGAGMPDVPEPQLDQLKPFLDGWSPHGPHRR